ncbi:MAG TPA: DUF58 domain-containing protein [Steroidobacteraceae bacterium]|jgi:uncharacterized protein (DUF58 family)|nr:DUF58 domain-containing protein [Steroidobacteraceae bacterium]
MRSSRQSRFLSEPRAALAAALARWARARQGDDMPPVTLQARRIYILPTASGVSAAALLFLMLLAGMNYANSLALMLCFMLCGVTLVSMHECHGMLSGLKLLRAEVDNTFAGRLGELQLYFDNAQTRVRAGLLLRSPGCAPSRFRLPPGGTQMVRVTFQAGARGRQRIERLELSSSAPLGLFRAWTWLHLPLEAIVYPAPGGARPLPARGGDALRGAWRSRVSGEEEWAWLRPLQDGDPPRSVAWKSYARGAPLLVAHYDAPAGVRRVLDFARLQGLPLEQRLSQLTQWVLDCERLGETYSLQLPQQSLQPGHGIAQQRACLEALGLYGQ